MAVSAKASIGVNPELAEEREKCSFKVIELTNLLDGASSGTEERRRIEQKFVDDPNISRYVDFAHFSCDDYYSKGVEMSMYKQKKLEEMDLLTQIPGDLQFSCNPHIAGITVPTGDPLIVHSFMFIPTILNQGTEEQQMKWISLARKKIIIGTYCQTELGHGTNMKGLETTATYDPKTEEFVLHSPTLSSIKFWPGGMGRTCNAAIIVAQLYTQGICHGVHPFFIQLRSLDDHKPLPGITVGELGPKMGLNANDNGFLKLDHVRIPRFNMLMKNNQVLSDGTYIVSKRKRAGYGTLIMARTAIVIEMSLRLSQAVTIAVRYSAVRRQGGSSKPGEPENKILDYQNQQFKLFPKVAMAYAGLFVFRFSYNKMLEYLANPSPTIAAEVHALSSGVKALCTQEAASGIELCRLACGGLGYLQASHLPFLYTYTTASCTYDGENTVLLLQTARFLIKAYHANEGGNADNSTGEFLNLIRLDNLQCPPNTNDRLDEIQFVFRKTAAMMLAHVAGRLVKEMATTGKTAEEIWNSHAVDLASCARLQVKNFVLYTMRKTIMDDTDMSESLRTVLLRLFELLALHWIRESGHDFIQHGGLPVAQFEDYNVRFYELLEEIRPDIVGLVDAFDFRDESLQSVIGCYDGRVYERVYEYLRNLPSNQVEVHPVYEKFLRPTNQSKL